MRIAVTGAAGGFGRHVVARALRAGHEVVAVDLPDAVPDEREPAVEWRGADLVDLDAVRMALAGTDAVAHLAALPGAYVRPEPQVHATNVAANYNVLLAAEELGLRAVCTASSVNAIGGIFSLLPRYDRFPVDEEHPTYCEDPYGLSKWVGEQEQAMFARRRPDVPFSALRLHALRTDHTSAVEEDGTARWRDLWGWVSFDAAAAAVLRALHRDRPGHAVYNVVAARTMSRTPSAELARRWFPQVPVAPTGTGGFYATGKALAELGWDARDERPAVTDAERGITFVTTEGPLRVGTRAEPSDRSLSFNSSERAAGARVGEGLRGRDRHDGGAGAPRPHAPQRVRPGTGAVGDPRRDGPQAPGEDALRRARLARHALRGRP